MQAIKYLGLDMHKIIDLHGGQINDPSLGKLYSLPFLATTPSSWSPTLERLFKADKAPFKGTHLSRYSRETVCCVALGAKVTGHCPEQQS